jgi:hypothetical protein
LLSLPAGSFPGPVDSFPGPAGSIPSSVGSFPGLAGSFPSSTGSFLGKASQDGSINSADYFFRQLHLSGDLNILW